MGGPGTKVHKSFVFTSLSKVVSRTHACDIHLTLYVAADREVFVARVQWMSPSWSRTKSSWHV